MGVNTTLLFGPGDSQVCATVNILEDVIVENYETFTLIIGSADQAVVIGQNTSEVTIAEDNDSKLCRATSTAPKRKHVTQLHADNAFPS